MCRDMKSKEFAQGINLIIELHDYNILDVVLTWFIIVSTY